MVNYLRVEILPIGFTQQILDDHINNLMNTLQLKDMLGKVNYKIIEVIPNDALNDMENITLIIYDYTNNRTLNVISNVENNKILDISINNRQPTPSNEEFEEAIIILKEKDEQIKNHLETGELIPYRPMPPIIKDKLSDGSIERTINIGLRPHGNKNQIHEIVSVNMITRVIIKYDKRAPPRSSAGIDLCGYPDARQEISGRRLRGKVNIIISHGNTELWNFIATRPSSSSGTNGSGIELQNVFYKGELILNQAHAPILNVLYDDGPLECNGCGPYRDWQYDEGHIQAQGKDQINGFMYCDNPAKTILDTNDDQGNFMGVAVFLDNDQVKLVSELEAGWYRYISEWGFSIDGIIKPRFGFGAVWNSCTCCDHHHHVYWRFDFGMGNANHVVQEYNDPPIMSSNWHTIKYETMRDRDYQKNRKWSISASNKKYELIPGPHDGIADEYARGDVWFLKFKQNEIDDGIRRISTRTEAEIDRFVNDELIENEHIICWYGAHYDHLSFNSGSNTIGPNIVPQF